MDKSAPTIRRMFAEVAPRYDLLNHLLSGALDVLWRRQAARVAVAAAPAGPLLDLCCGTGDQAIALHRRGRRVAASDFCVPMLARARRKYRRLGTRSPAGLAADALELPLPSGAFAGVTVSFGLRNVASLDGALREMTRVLAPGGVVAILEFALPVSRLLRVPYLFYFRHVLPRIGRLVSPSRSAYSYLPASVAEFPQRQAFLDRLAAAGLGDLAWRDLGGGAVCLYTGRRVTV